MLSNLSKNKAIFLMGPTAAGKTDLAMQFSEAMRAKQIAVDIISVDSAMVYRGMDIGTGKPNAQDLAQFPHQLIDICDPSTAYSAAQFCNDATAAMQRSWQQQRIPLLVGGTMLYFKALQFGLAELPSADADLRAEISQQAQDLGWAAMHAKLAVLDAEAAQRLKPQDTQRIQRALEINILTGKTLRANFNLQPKHDLDCQLHTFAITPLIREDLHKKIALRFDRMLDAGFVSEVQHLFTRGDLHADLPAIRAVGYRQIWSYLQQDIDFGSMREQAIAATRQLAKRQYTWLRSWSKAITIESSDTAALDTMISTVLHSDY